MNIPITEARNSITTTIDVASPDGKIYYCCLSLDITFSDFLLVFLFPRLLERHPACFYDCFCNNLMIIHLSSHLVVYTTYWLTSLHHLMPEQSNIWVCWNTIVLHLVLASPDDVNSFFHVFLCVHICLYIFLCVLFLVSCQTHIRTL